MLEYWFMFPVALVFSTIAMMTGIGGAAMFTPFFFLILHLQAPVAVGVGLFIELFGFTSGLNAYARRKWIAYPVGVSLLAVTVPAAIFGVFISHLIPDPLIKITFAALLLSLAMLILKPKRIWHHHHHQHQAKHNKHATHKFYTTPKSRAHLWISAFGGLLTGMVSTGIGETNNLILMNKYKMRGPILAGTSVFIVVVTVLISSFAHGFALVNVEGSFSQVISIIIFAVPAVAIGGQLGAYLSQWVDEQFRKKFVAILFLVLAVVTFLSLYF